MEERKFVRFKKDELAMKKYIWRSLGKGKVSSIQVEYTPIGEKIIVSTDKPGLIIGSRGERINELTEVLKKRFKRYGFVLVERYINQLFVVFF